ncbi:hypothetical protein ACLMJK_006697 [Lecanora helva]
MASQEPQFFIKARGAGRLVVDESPKFDLEAYIANYRGRTRFERLLVIGLTSTQLCLEALKAAITEAKQGEDAQRYETAWSMLQDVAPQDPDALFDVAWVERTNKQVKAETDKKELELKGYKNNLIKESIRMGYDDLGQHYHAVGDLTKSNKAYATMRDYCTTNQHIVIMNMNLIKVSIDQGSWFAVQNHVQRIRGSAGAHKYPEAEKNSAKLSAAHALASLAQSNYRDAAEEFLATDPRMSTAKLDDPADEEKYNEILTPNDVAVYGGLCALASMTREELQAKVLDNNDFRNYLELEPHIRRAISHFVSAKYSQCLSILDSYRADYLLDIYLKPHLLRLYSDIRSKAIQQYFIPFSTVTLAALSEAFNTDERTIEHELIQLIKNKDLDARIDLIDRVLVARQVDPRRQMLADALEAAKEHERTLHLRMLRMAILNAGLEVRSPKDKGSQGAGGNINGSGDLIIGESQSRIGTRGGSVW